MKLSYINGFGNKGNTFVSQGILKSSLPYQANLNNTHQYLTPDYFLASSYYSRKYSVSTNFSNHKSLKSRVKQVATVSLIFLSMVTGEVFAGDKRPKSKASSGKKQEVTFEAIALSSALPDVVPHFPLPDVVPLEPSNPPVPSAPPLPSVSTPPVILPDVVPVPPAPPPPPAIAPAPPPMPDLLVDASSSVPKQKTGFIQAMKDIVKGNFKLKKVKKEKKEVIASDSNDLMTQLHNTLERRRTAISGEKGNKKFKKAAKQVIALNAEEEKAREVEIAKKIAENKEKAATLRKQKEKEWAIKAKQIEAEVEIEKQRKAAEHAKAMREQKAKENGNDSSTVIAGIDPVLHNNIVTELRSEINSLKEQLSLNGNVTSGVMNDLDANNHVRLKRAVISDEVIDKKDQSTSTEDLNVLEARLYDEKLENWEFEEDEAVKKLDAVISGYDDLDKEFAKSIAEIEEMLTDEIDDKQLTEDSSSTIKVADSKEAISQAVQQELVDVQKALEERAIKEEEEVEAVEDILGQDIITDTVSSGVDTTNSPVGYQEELVERARLISRAREDLRFGSKLVSNQIRHRLHAQEIGSMAAVSAGDEEESQDPSYSVWSSGIFGGAKQKDTSNIIGHSSKVHGGSIGGEINLSNDLMFGASLSRLHSTFKYLPMLNSKHNVSKTNTNIFSIYSSATMAENINLQTLASVALSGKAAKQQDIVTPKSKLFSFESHLNQRITWGNNITLIPSLGFRYEYGNVGASRDIILDSYVLHHKKSKSRVLSGEVGARVLFTPIKLSSDFKLIPTAHISLDKRIVSTGGKSGQLLSIKDIGGEATVVSGNANREKLSMNIGSGIIASHKNMSLEFLYDLQKQRSFKSHQGVLKLKVNL